MSDIVYISIAIAIGLLASTLIFNLFLFLKGLVEKYFFDRWVFFETGLYQNIETGDVIVAQNSEMQEVEEGLHKGQYVKVDNEYGVYFYDKINEGD